MVHNRLGSEGVWTREIYDKWTEDLHLQVATLCRSVGQGMPLTGMMVLALTDPQELVD